MAPISSFVLGDPSLSCTPASRAYGTINGIDGMLMQLIMQFGILMPARNCMLKVVQQQLECCPFSDALI